MSVETHPLLPPAAAGQGSRLRILVLNWRDIRHPAAGGAERVTYEMARRWREWGHDVTWFAASFPGAPSRETIDGIDVWRAGSQATVHWQAFRHYRRHFRGRFDVVVDEVNTIPFFTPLYARSPVVLFLHQLARDVWFYEAPWPLAALGYVAEPLYFQPYRRVPLLTVSESTKRDAQRLGLHAPATILPVAIDLPSAPRLPDLAEKESRWTLIYVGRVVPSKRVAHLIQALRWLREKHGQSAQLWIVGTVSDRYRQTLEALVTREGLTDSVVFWGHVPVDAKKDLLQRAHVLVMTSVREGWGLSVSEAAAAGTPSAVYDVPGLRDSTIHEQTGLICRQNSSEALADAVAQMMLDPDLYLRLRETAWGRTATMWWDRTAEAGLCALEEAIERHTAKSPEDRRMVGSSGTPSAPVLPEMVPDERAHNRTGPASYGVMPRTASSPAAIGLQGGCTLLVFLMVALFVRPDSVVGIDVMAAVLLATLLYGLVLPAALAGATIGTMLVAFLFTLVQSGGPVVLPPPRATLPFGGASSVESGNTFSLFGSSAEGLASALLLVAFEGLCVLMIVRSVEWWRSGRAQSVRLADRWWHWRTVALAIASLAAVGTIVLWSGSVALGLLVAVALGLSLTGIVESTLFTVAGAVQIACCLILLAIEESGLLAQSQTAVAFLSAHGITSFQPLCSTLGACAAGLLVAGLLGRAAGPSEQRNDPAIVRTGTKTWGVK